MTQSGNFSSHDLHVRPNSSVETEHATDLEWTNECLEMGDMESSTHQMHGRGSSEPGVPWVEKMFQEDHEVERSQGTRYGELSRVEIWVYAIE